MAQALPEQSRSFSRVGSGRRRALYPSAPLTTAMTIAMTMAMTAALVVGERAAPAQPAKAPAAAAASPTESAPLPPEGWWVPATLKMPRAAEGRLAWRFTLKEIITVSKDNKLERHPSDLVAVATAPGRPRTWKTTASQAVKDEATAAASPARPVSALPPISIEYDESKGSLTLTFTGSKAAFFTLNPAGSEDSHRFDNLVIDKHADSAEVRDACDKATRCCRFTQQPAECVPKNTERTLSRCKEILNTVRQELGSEHRAIPSACR
jgi:hypothetical protein